MVDNLMYFTVYSIEEYKEVHNISGKEALALFNKYKVFNYINECYDALHTFGGDEVVWNIDEYIKNSKKE